MVEQRMSIGRMEEAINVFGSFDENIRLIESELHVAVTNRSPLRRGAEDHRRSGERAAGCPRTEGAAGSVGQG